MVKSAKRARALEIEDHCEAVKRAKIGRGRRGVEPISIPSSVKRTFDMWAGNGRAEMMEREHSYSVLKHMAKVPTPRRFLDVGCGNGWFVRHMASDPQCIKAVGIDKSSKMIKSAKKLSQHASEDFVATSIESWKYRGKFDLVFSMEALYYSDSIDEALAAIYKILAPGGTLICGTDFYTENRATRWWGREMKVTMHLLSCAQWRNAFKRAGLETKTNKVKNPNGSKEWKRKMGTLFITGTKS